MTVSWTPHRFTGGILALDTANTVVLRNDPEKTFDRFDDPAEIARFAEAASGFRAAELGGRRLQAPEPGDIAPVVLSIREATDRLFRHAITKGAIAAGHLPDFLTACASGLSGSATEIGAPGQPFGDPATPIAFEAALAVSALSLLRDDTVARLRICPNCSWLFVDRSRNASRLWCDMAVCGNRQKANRYYRRRTAAREVTNA
ncbi:MULTISPECIES: CGNR zinc finger domain-containing protein [unclassified Mesorhizobium]|uniref:CGNR zinc finger domain-containing protein n=1 Tax=unclassified Mesorhizobium TaxID=325217 RepID=UPI002416E35E|nr:MULTISPECIES: CGNR zinc finger domain-containing protein [unclassified Mesorhizobium]MDG4882403.1 CGNR zinc finger domain-containing protein [Mesorhizobium sp. WSM4884]WFP63310.1 CGNR zinc finger domain-containing protein [Mesorhizobium sp. WSM4904]WFP76576.1 CGNR zinc finger domain-containing protein [Mesorhizobium sp. WSM4906]